MVLLISMMSVSTLGPSRQLSGRISRRAEGAEPTYSSTRCQYSGWEVYWSQATTDHLAYSQLTGRRISAGEKGSAVKSADMGTPPDK